MTIRRAATDDVGLPGTAVILNQPEPACLVIADISGYTGFLAGAVLDHAQDILADLMGTVVSALRPTFRLAKLEGDAAFVSAMTDTIDGPQLQDTIERCCFGDGRTRMELRFGMPRSAKERAIAEPIMPMIDEMVTDGLAHLGPIVEAGARETEARAAPEPVVPAGRARNLREPIVRAG